MPPFQSRSTGAWRIAFISSAGVMRGDAVVDAERLRGPASSSGIDLSERGKTPPPSEIRLLS